MSKHRASASQNSFGSLFFAIAVGASGLLMANVSCQRSASKDAESESVDPAAKASKAATDLADPATALPGAAPVSRVLRARFLAAVKARGPGYVPRTRHKKADGSAKYINRLVLESSPYLRQHAHNPVNWYPWGDDAFAAAKKLDRPIFLSIGYSTCHWCHVMEEESFEDPEIAAYLNEHFIAIKVDREERPDLDAIYMSAVQLMTGRGGWPMTVFMTQEKLPFFGGTYFPPRTGARGSRTGLLELLQRIAAGWTDDREQVLESATKLSRALAGEMRPGIAGMSVNAAAALRSAASGYSSGFDSTWGGLRIRRGGSKFPSSFPIRFLLRYGRRANDPSFRKMALFTLQKMAAGGMHDQVGGGFHRYSTDEKWLVPHFEKMLYDNALLVMAYLDGYQATGDADLARVARDVLRYVRREMTSPDGGFYSATDADSPLGNGESEEGAFFVWTPQQLREALGTRAALVERYYAVTRRGNFEGKNILWTPKPLAKIAKESKLSLAKAREAIRAANEVLYIVRAKRLPPARDDKILTAWNGLMISAFARAENVLGPNTDGGPSYADQARRAATLILDKLRVDGRLQRTWTGGEAKLNGYLNDYAFTIAGLLDLFEATGERRWFDEARALDVVLREHYEDDDGGGFFMTSGDHETLIARYKPDRDGALPSGNSIAAMNLIRMYAFTGDEAFRERAEKLFSAFADTLSTRPSSLSHMLLALDEYIDTVKQIVLVTPAGREQAEPFLRELRSRYVPSKIVMVVAEGDVAELAKSVPLVAGKKALRGTTTAYVCEQQRCELPTNDPAVFAKQISKVIPLPAK